MTVFDLAQPTPRTFLLASPGRDAVLLDQAIGISPAGKYLAAIVGSKLVVHDLATGQSRGTSDVPAEATAVASRCKEIIFSRDGNHLATLVIASDQQSVCLLEWDFASGKLTQNKRWELSAWLRQLSDFSPAHEEHPLVPLPEGGGYVLFGRLIWKPNADLPEQAFPLGTDNYPRVLLDTMHVVAFTRDPQGESSLNVLGRTDLGVAGMTMPKPVEPASGDRWKVRPDPAQGTPRLSARPLAFFGNVPQRPCLPKRPGKHGVCALGKEYIVFDLESCQEVKRFHPPGKVELIHDISGDGRHFVTSDATDSTQQKFTVFNATTGDVVMTGNQPTGSGDVTIEFTRPSHLMIAFREPDSGQRRCVVWDIEKKMPASEFATPNGLGAYLPGSHVLTPGGNIHLCVFGNTLLCHDVATGGLLGRVSLPLAANRVNPKGIVAAALPLDGTQLHLLAEYHDDTLRILTIEMLSGNLASKDVDPSSDFSRPQQSSLIEQVPWLLPDAKWLIARQAAVQISDGSIVGPLGLAAESAVIPLPQRNLLVATVHISLQSTPAAAIAPTKLERNSGTLLVAAVEGLRPKTVATTRPQPRPMDSTGTPKPVDPLVNVVPKRTWKVVVDPPTEEKPLAPSKTFAAEIGRSPRFIASDRNGAFIVIIDEQSETARVLNLATGKLVKDSFAFPRQATVAAISPDGALVAFAQGTDISIRHVATGKTSTVRREGSFLEFRYLGFDHANHLVAAYTDNDRVTLVIWPQEGGEPLHTWLLGDKGDDWAVRNAGLAISPGGRYLAALRYDGLAIFDLQKPETMQTAILPFADTKSQQIYFQCDGIRFSPDGRRLAASYAQLQQNYIAIWNLESGEPEILRPTGRPIHLRTITHSDYAPRLAWLSGRRIASLLRLHPARRHHRLPLLGRRTRRSTYHSPPAVRDDTGHWRQRRQTRAVLASYGDCNCAGGGAESPAEFIPPLKATDLKPAPLVSQELTGRVETDGLAAKLPGGPIQFADLTAESRPSRVVISSTGVLALEREVDYLSVSRKVVTAGPLSPAREVALETYDLISGGRQHRLEVPESAQLLDISPDGTLLLTGDSLPGSGGYSRFDVWAPKLGKHAAGWQPVGPESDFGSVATWAGFVDKRHILVRTPAQLTCWQLPECRQVYAVSSNTPPTFSPNRKQFLDRQHALIRDAASGRACRSSKSAASRRDIFSTPTSVPAARRSLASWANQRSTRSSVGVSRVARFSTSFPSRQFSSRTPRYWASEGCCF